MTHPADFAKRVFLPALLVFALAFSFQPIAPSQAFAQNTGGLLTMAETDDSQETSADPSEATNPPDEVTTIPPHVNYRVSLKKGSWSPLASDYAIAGKTNSSARVRNVKISLDNGSYAGSLKYRVKVAGGKWTNWTYSGKAVGTSNNIEAIQVKLTGKISKTYDVVYRAYVDSVGWQRRMRNGESAGVVGKNLRIEALRVQLVEKTRASGWIKAANGAWSYYNKGKAMRSTWLSTSESPIDTSLAGSHRYWLDAQGTLAVNRYILPSTLNDSKSGFAAYATEAGYPFCGKRVADGQITLSDENGKLYKNTQWLTTSAFDGSKQRYRLQNAGDYAVVKTGLFYVKGYLYYGYEDERGYLMRSTTKWMVNAWYKANSKGELLNVNGDVSGHIERYVKWAIKIARDDSHGYSQYNRWGPDYDCSSLVCSALLAAGFYDSGATYTGNMRERLQSVGFVWHTDLSDLRRGDIMLVHHENGRQHTEIYIGKNKLVGAHIAETGGIHGISGDQTGNEISVTRYYNAPWDGFLRYVS
ncbi:MAG: C40 family peptidase [Eggerthellaceae bacterium]|nr:C40 family peptidase [Eggerthellaceae bacterium]